MSAKEAVELASASIGLLVKLILTVAACVVLYYVATAPERSRRAFDGHLARMGLEVQKVEIFGATLNQVKDVQEALATLRREIEPEVSPETLEVLDSSVARLGGTIAASEAQMTQAGPPQASPAPGWVVVAGADRNLDAARDEEGKLEAASFEARLFYRDNWYRTAAIFPSEAEAREAAPRVAEIMGRTPYVRNLATWCRNLTQAEGYETCAGG